MRRDTVPDVPSGGRGKRPQWAPLLAKRLAGLGYRTYHSGKWHLDGMPLGEGFDRSYYLRDQGRFFSPQAHFLDDKKLAPVKRGSGYYGTVPLPITPFNACRITTSGTLGGRSFTTWPSRRRISHSTPCRKTSLATSGVMGTAGSRLDSVAGPGRPNWA